MDSLVGSDWLERELGAPDLRVLDCTVTTEMLPSGDVNHRNGREEWERQHIPGSVHVDVLERISDNTGVPLMLPPPHQFSEAMSELGIGEGTRVVVYDRFVNIWAARVWWMLRAFGFDDAAILDGGWQAWVADGRPVSTGPEADIAPARFLVSVRPGIFVGKDDVLAALDRPETRIVDALERERYRGERADFGRAGHIPGARNVPFTELVDPGTHRYLPDDRLRAAFSDVLSGDPEQVINYCGGAIAAASDAFVLNLLGVENVAIYDGSMMEWAADPALPLVVAD